MGYTKRSPWLAVSILFATFFFASCLRDNGATTPAENLKLDEADLNPRLSFLNKGLGIALENIGIYVDSVTLDSSYIIGSVISEEMKDRAKAQKLELRGGGLAL